MNILLDTHLLLWAADQKLGDLSPAAAELIDDPSNALHFSAVSLWEIAIKSALGRPDFEVDAAMLRRGLLDNGYIEIAVTSEHAVAVGRLAPIHKDPFDRMLIAQTGSEGVLLLTADAKVARYPGSIRKV